MTDIAVPMPEPKDQTLTLEQRRRVEALKVSRQVLENKPALFSGAKLAEDRMTYELITLADWILNGSLEDDSEQEPEADADLRDDDV